MPGKGRVICFMLVLLVFMSGWDSWNFKIYGDTGKTVNIPEKIITDAVNDNKNKATIHKGEIVISAASRNAQTQNNLGKAGAADDVVNELFSIMAEIAVDKAKSNTVNIIIKKIQKVFGDDDIGLLFPETKRVIDSLTVSNLASSSQFLINAMITDTGMLMENYFSVMVTSGKVQTDDIKLLFKIFYSVMMRDRGNPSDFVNGLAAVKWSNEKINVILVSIRILEKIPEKFPVDILADKGKIIKKLKEADATADDVISDQELLEILRNYDNAIRNSSTDRKVRLRALSDFYFSMLKIMTSSKNDPYIDALEKLVNARIDNDNHALVVSIFELMDYTIQTGNMSSINNQTKIMLGQINKIEETIKKCGNDGSILEINEIIRNDRTVLQEVIDNALSIYIDLKQIKEADDIEKLETLYTSCKTKYESIKQKLGEVKGSIGSLKEKVKGVKCTEESDKERIIALLDSIDNDLDKWNNRITKYISFYDTKINIAIKKFKRVKPLINAITAYSVTYSDEPAGVNTTEIREARKQIIENLIRETANRYERYDEWVVSTGINTGFLFTGRTRDGWDLYPPLLSLPLGLYVQNLPEEKAWHPSDAWPTHYGFYFFDLGQYLFYDKNSEVKDVSWENAFTLGAQVGWFFFSTPDMLFNICLDVRYSPALNIEGEKKKKDVWAGITLSYYVPFFDFN